MYYNVQSEAGMVLGAEILTPAPQFEGIVRLKADVIEQRSRQSFLAYNAAMTSSRIGVPRYWLQADRLRLEDPRPNADQNQSAAIVKLAPRAWKLLPETILYTSVVYRSSIGRS